MQILILVHWGIRLIWMLYTLVYLSCSSLEQQIKLVLIFLIYSQFTIYNTDSFPDKSWKLNLNISSFLLLLVYTYPSQVWINLRLVSMYERSLYLSSMHMWWKMKIADLLRSDQSVLRNTVCYFLSNLLSSIDAINKRFIN